MSGWFGVNLISVWPSICTHKKSYHQCFPQVVIRWNCKTPPGHKTNVTFYYVEQHDVKLNTLLNWKQLFWLKITWLHVFGKVIWKRYSLVELQTVKVNVFDCIGRWRRESISFLQDSTGITSWHLCNILLPFFSTPVRVLHGFSAEK